MVGPRTAAIRTGNTSTFTLKQRRLHIVLLDPREAPYADREYVLTVGKTEHHGRTAADGSLCHEVPGLSMGELLLKLPAPEAGPRVEAAPEPPPRAPPPYPPPVFDRDFPDASDVTAPRDVTLCWDLQLQSPASFDGDALRAAQERLHNLGFTIDGERGAPGPRTKAAVRAFQRRHGLPETGQLADVQRELIRQHDA
ncbi:peptidoglycan-binding protein [Pyxidicoccus fallax]|uniref:Peptidoglycan-binding protein n=1 Tax=Pyxidicoccus fallax TaxID=394095 RepID=A0A848LW65_9BACT|nr:peptidoglycan-binding domain-containing protein [Pyxidicoccus fallax]NMO21860.1 peptidoglycan-binding protein [Pyxidicoccus fallax]NPC83328.1 peptidoglycan-binding protein [Pyxidicoccus fallax]